ncbi:hypothetical protein [Kineococcus sp. R86509]|uniref:hypothetical protein n=1 Tax=Kineococcus sp. R86509 TaxID=3093851 RepID=UPI0036D2238A
MGNDRASSAGPADDAGSSEHAQDLVVEVGGWEHDCCGPAIERNAVIELSVYPWTGPDGRERLVEGRHDIGEAGTPVYQRVRGRVTNLHVVHEDGTIEAIARVPSGSALCGTDDGDDGHLETPWTGELIAARGSEFLVTLQQAPQVQQAQ